jgi:hypothetical protein
MDTGIAFLICLIAGAVCAAVAASKNRSAVGYGLLGFVLPLIGIIVVLCIGIHESSDDRARRLAADGQAYQAGMIAAWQAAHPAAGATHQYSPGYPVEASSGPSDAGQR